MKVVNKWKNKITLSVSYTLKKVVNKWKNKISI